jgi:hypothetical protein
MIAQSRSLALIALDLRTLDPFHRIIRYGVRVAEMLKQRGQRSELASDRCPGQRTLLQILAPCEHVCARDYPKLLGLVDTDKLHELMDIDSIGAARVRIFDIGKPLCLRRHPGKLTKLHCRQCSSSLGECRQLALVLFYGFIKVFAHTSILS